MQHSYRCWKNLFELYELEIRYVNVQIICKLNAILKNNNKEFRDVFRNVTVELLNINKIYLKRFSNIQKIMHLNTTRIRKKLNTITLKLLITI